MHAGVHFQGRLSQSTESPADIFIIRALDSSFLRGYIFGRPAQVASPKVTGKACGTRTNLE